MPTYQYACAACGHELEAVQAFTDDPLTVCPECGGQLRKRFSAVGVVFKGSGFYRTDSRSAKSSSDGGATKKEPAKADSGGSTPSTSSGSSSSGSSDSGSSGSGSGSGSSGKDTAKKSSNNSGSKVA